MTQSVELLLDPDADTAVRGEWAALVDAGLPSQGLHTGSSNAPHVTLAVADALSDSQENDLHQLAEGLPVRTDLGGLVLFPQRKGVVLARVVVPSVELLELQARAAGVVLPVDPYLGPGRWTAHVTLARRLDPQQVARALEVLGDARGHAARAVAVRRWDSVRKITWQLGSRPDHHFE